LHAVGKEPVVHDLPEADCNRGEEQELTPDHRRDEAELVRIEPVDVVEN